jgi:hypothetical protein
MRRGHWIPFVLVLLGLVAADRCFAQVREVELKAAYIYNFAMFTTWPDGAGAHGPLLVCANPASPLWPSLQSLSSQSVNGRPWTVVDAANPAGAPGAKGARCDILVLPRTAERPAPQAGVLVVRDGPQGGPRQDASITLIDDDEHVRFDVDTQEAAKSGLRFSSRLLRLARNVQ